MSTDPLALAIRLAYGDVDPAALGWLAEGFRRWLSGQADSLEVALRVTGAGRITARNRALLRAGVLLADGREQSAWRLAGKLSEAIRHFESRTLARLRANPECHLSEVDAALLDARRAGATWMRSRRRLYELLRTDIPE